jgi:hypothetical protein
MSELIRIPRSGTPQRMLPSLRRAADPEPDDSFELRQLVRVLARHKRQILIVALLVLVFVHPMPSQHAASRLVDARQRSEPVQVLRCRKSTARTSLRTTSCS